MIAVIGALLVGRLELGITDGLALRIMDGLALGIIGGCTSTWNR